MMDSFSKIACFTIHKFKVCMDCMKAHILCTSEWCSYGDSDLIRTIHLYIIFGICIDTGNQGQVQVWSVKECIVGPKSYAGGFLYKDDTKPLP